MTGNKNIKKESVKYHKSSVQHNQAAAAKLANEMRDRNELHPIECGFQKMDQANYEAMVKLFRTACYIALREKPFADFPRLLELRTTRFEWS